MFLPNWHNPWKIQSGRRALFTRLRSRRQQNSSRSKIPLANYIGFNNPISITLFRFCRWIHDNIRILTMFDTNLTQIVHLGVENFWVSHKKTWAVSIYKTALNFWDNETIKENRTEYLHKVTLSDLSYASTFWPAKCSKNYTIALAALLTYNTWPESFLWWQVSKSTRCNDRSVSAHFDAQKTCTSFKPPRHIASSRHCTSCTVQHRNVSR